MTIETRAFLAVALQRALLGQISAALRGVSADYSEDAVHLAFFFDGPVSEADRASASEVEGELLADLEPGRSVSVEVRRIDAPTALPDSGFWVFRRRE